MTLPSNESRFRIPSSIRLLLSPDVRVHTFLFGLVTLAMLVIAFLGRIYGVAGAWAIIFAAGAGLAATYLALTPLALSETFGRYLFHSKIRTKVTIVGATFGMMVAAFSYWILQAGSVEALPIFPAFLVIFYVWILLQAYFIATPVTHALEKIESDLTGEKFAKKMVRTLGVGLLFLPVMPLVYGVWLVSNWLSSTYQSVPDAGGKIIVWAIGMIAAILFTFFVTVSWTWPVVRRGRPQVAIFAGGAFSLVWGYLLYRGVSLAMGYLSQSQPTNAFADISLMFVSIIGAMQTFTKKTINRANTQWAQVLPFLVFSFGAIYAVAQLYFIVQVPITRVDLSIFVNVTVLVSGIATLMLLIRRHVFSESPPLVLSKTGEAGPSAPEPSRKSALAFLRPLWSRREK